LLKLVHPVKLRQSLIREGHLVHALSGRKNGKTGQFLGLEGLRLFVRVLSSMKPNCLIAPHTAATLFLPVAGCIRMPRGAKLGKHA
jgi:hypothetical protein